jgi:hypothetical protein
LLFIYVLVAWLVAALTARQIGANVNYFFEPLMASAPIAAAAAWRLHELRLRTPIFVTVSAALLLASLTAPKFLNNLELMRAAYREAEARPERLKRWSAFRTALEGKRVLSAFPETAVWSSRPELLDPYLSHVLERIGGWSPAPIVEDVRQQTYDVVMVPVKIEQYRGLDLLSVRIQVALDHFYAPYCTWQGATRRLEWGQGMMILVPKQERVSSAGLKDELVRAGCRVDVKETEGS